MEKTYEIYRLTNTVNNKIYVGGTTDGAGYRFKRHIVKAKAGSEYPLHKAIVEFGEQNFKLDILEMCDNLDHMNEREAYWIATLSSTNPEVGYNGKVGGGIRFQTEESRTKIGNVHRGKISDHRKAVLQYDAFGNLIKEFPSLQSASEETGIQRTSILRVINKKAMKPSKKNPYLWIYRDSFDEVPLHVELKDYFLDLNRVEGNVENLRKTWEKNQVVNGNMAGRALPVEQYDLQNNLIARYKSIAEAAEKSGVSTTTIKRYLNNPEYVANLKGAQRSQFLWKRGDVNDESLRMTLKESREKAAAKYAKKIECYTLDGIKVSEHHGIVELAKRLHSDSRTLKSYILDGVPFKGFLWKFRD